MPYVYSTMTASQMYTGWSKTGDGGHTVERQILINGGSNVADPRTLITPRGVATPVSDDDLSFLRTIPAFVAHEEAGFVTVAKSSVDPEVAASDMASADASAPLTENDARTTEAPTKRKAS